MRRLERLEAWRRARERGLIKVLMRHSQLAVAWDKQRRRRGRKRRSGGGGRRRRRSFICDYRGAGRLIEVALLHSRRLEPLQEPLSFVFVTVPVPIPSLP
jgi:hypothetical protein